MNAEYEVEIVCSRKTDNWSSHSLYELTRSTRSDNPYKPLVTIHPGVLVLTSLPCFSVQKIGWWCH